MKKVIVMMFALFMCTYTFAQDNKLLETLVNKKVITQAEADAIRLEDTKSGASLKKIKNPLGNNMLNISGYGILKYEYDNKAQGRNSRHDFKPRVVYLTISGTINKFFRYNMLADLANPKLHELWIEFTACDYFNLKIGQFKNPLSFENQFAPGNLEYGMFSRPTAHLMGHGKDVIGQYSGRDTPNSIGRDLGIQASGTIIKLQEQKFLDYAVALFQGSGINIKDPDNTKDIAAALTMYPIKGLRIGGGVHFGEATYGGNKTTGTPDVKHVRNRYVGSIEYAYDRMKFRYEYMKGKDSTVDHDGMYGMAMYDLIPKKINVLGKVSYFNMNTNTSAEVMDYTLGFNYNIFKMTRIQLNYTYSDYTNTGKAAFKAEDNHNVLVQFQIGF